MAFRNRFNQQFTTRSGRRCRVLIEPLDADAIADAMRRVLEDHEFADDLSRRGIERAVDFTWRRTAEDTTAVYLKVLAA